MMGMRLRWVIGSLMFLAGMINYLDRSALGVAAPLIRQDLHLDASQLGIVFSSFSFGYALFCFVGGYASDRFGPRNVMGVSMIAWSIFCGLTAAAWSVASLLVVRILFGMGEGPIGSTFNKTVRNWFPHGQQASAVSVANAGTPLGAAVSGPVVGLLALSVGWRPAFIIIALIGIAWVVFWYAIATDHPRENGRITSQELAEFEDGQKTQPPPSASPQPLGSLIARPAILATAFAFFGYSCILFFFLTWFPTYLVSARHLSIASMSFATTIPWLVGFIGLTAGGPLCDLIFKMTGNPILARKLVLVVCLLVAALCIGLAGEADTVFSAVALMTVSVFFMYLTGNTYWAIILDTIEQDRVGGVSGFVHFIANCGGIVAPLMTGFIVQATGSFFAAFLATGAIAVLGALGVAVFVRAPAAAAIGGRLRAVG
ncbi:MAG TPA: MFS transporter [Rhodopila sp.]|uniref:MFS transporter n=1 Tax=Rhodopila sp. TaxID=2480087 RepID=UPI002C0D67E5|nr:MFS transporter [Rhodopila sp.]HVY15217.1 MFS transporter [Rhodopila sp.]